MSASQQRRWAADDIAAIRRLAESGCTGAQIAAHYRVSRNAVIGVCTRNAIKLGGAHPDFRKRSACSGEIARLRIAEKRKEARQRTAARVALPAPELPPPPPPAPPEGISITDLTNTTCRWPVHDQLPGRYCGKHSDTGRYCGEHERQAVSHGSGRKT
jgi:hypothetical protein